MANPHKSSTTSSSPDPDFVSDNIGVPLRDFLLSIGSDKMQSYLEGSVHASLDNVGKDRAKYWSDIIRDIKTTVPSLEDDKFGSFEFRVGKHDCHTRKAGIQRFLSAMRDDRLDDTPLSFPSCSRGSQGKLASGMTSSLTHSKLERAINSMQL